MRFSKNGHVRFTDAAWREDSRDAGFGWIFVDYLSKSKKHVSSPLMAEAMALLIALQQAGL